MVPYTPWVVCGIAWNTVEIQGMMGGRGIGDISTLRSVNDVCVLQELAVRAEDKFCPDVFHAQVSPDGSMLAQSPSPFSDHVFRFRLEIRARKEHKHTSSDFQYT